ncbi:MAG: hypothetical protein HYV27_15850 [Candidatus Hydrogenedentes bacterium]|nr:hypothetical protein [Candidatus Hydrogenedentota bacterium]
MIANLIAFVERKKLDELSNLTLQDAALCRAWANAHADLPGKHPLVEKLNSAVSQWTANYVTGETATAGQRSQLMLRTLIDDLKQDSHQNISIGEVAFAHAVHILLQDGGVRERSPRVAELLEPEAEILRKRLETDRTPLDFTDLESRQLYITSREISAAPVMETRLLAGIELPSRGPLIKVASHVRVLDDVPENCTLVVEGLHHCAVDGYVMGRVLSKLHCDVMANISGVVVVLQGDIRVRSIINNAKVISKMGSVRCQSAQGPKLIFAGKSIHVQEGAMLGTLVTRVLTVGGEVKGGHLQVADQCAASHFRHLGQSALTVSLRRELCCEDYGEITGNELKRLLSKAFRLRRIAHNYQLLASTTRNEVEHGAQAVLMYLFGGSDTHKKLEDYLQTQRRLGIVTRILDNMSLAMEGAQDSLSHKGDFEKDDIQDPALNTLSDEDQVDEDLRREHEEVDALRKSMDSAAMDYRQTGLLLDQARGKHRKLTEERDALQALLKQKEKNIQSLENYEKVLAASAAGTDSKIKVLLKILPAIRKQPENSPLAMSLRSPFIAMTMGIIERKLKHIKEYEARRASCLDDFRALADRLGKDFQVQVLERPEESGAARVTGIFEKGIRIAVVDSPGGALTPEESCFLTEGDELPHTYYRTNTSMRVFAK